MNTHVSPDVKSLPELTQERSREQAATRSKARTGLTGRFRFRDVTVHLVLLAIAAISLLPLLYMVSTSLKERGREFAYPIEWIPNPVVWSNYRTALETVQAMTFFANTMIVTVLTLIGGLLTASLAAYGFARTRFPGRDFFFMLMLSSMMLPYMVTLIPQFVLFRELGWVNTLYPLIVPSFFGGAPFYIFLLRQFFKGLPTDLEDAAKLDGAGFFRIWWTVAMPLAGPALATVAILSILHHWNDFIAPLVYLHTRDNWTLALGIRLFRDQYQVLFNLTMAYAVMMTIPVFTVFFAFQKYFVRGITISGMGGR
ncbi:MAG: carbohydrate ABC transporter permease [Chloroflexota bacterium]|nr:carbohydrate ABC transporter permease [Chloroflexota bacterium]